VNDRAGDPNTTLGRPCGEGTMIEIAYGYEKAASDRPHCFMEHARSAFPMAGWAPDS